MSEVVLFTGVNSRLGFGRYAGTYRLATELRSHGFTVQVIDFFGDMPPSDVYKVVDKHVTSKTLWVGFSTTLYNGYVPDSEEEDFWTKESTVNLVQKHIGLYLNFMPYNDDVMAEMFRRINKNSQAKIVVGGYKALTSNYPGVDYWVAGQGEGPAVAISRHLKYNEPLDYIDTDVGKVVTDKMYEFLNFSNSTIKWDESDRIFEGEDLPIELARGCVFKCSFCAFPLNGKKFGDYTRSTESLRDELIYNYENFGTTGYMVSDDTINDSMRKIDHLHQMFTSLPFKVRLTGYLRLDVLAKNKKMIPMLKEMGLSCCNFGIETFNQKAGAAISKPADPELLKETLYELRDEWKDDVFTTANFIVGLPHESKESIQSTFDWLHKPDVPLHGIFVTRLYIKQFPTTIQKPNNLTDSQMMEYGFIKVPDGWQYTNASKIQNNAEEYNIEYGEDKWWNWTSEHMTCEEAEELANSFYADPRNRHLKMGFVYPYSRLRNVGYERSDIQHMDLSQEDVVKDILIKGRVLRNHYIEQLCKD